MSETWMANNPDSPDMPRMVFYLAEAYSRVDTTKSIEFYKRRLGMDGYAQEKYVSLLKLAQLVSVPAEKLMYLYSAQEADSNRLEAFYYMLMHFYSQNPQKHKQAVGVFIAAPSSRTPPPGSLFVQREIYDYLFDMNASISLYYTGDYKRAYEVGTALLSRKTYPSHVEAQLQRNLTYFREKYNPERLELASGKFSRVAPNEVLPSVIIIDNFYEKPLEVREKALKMEYGVKGNYPGARTESVATEEDKKRFERIIGRPITYWPTQYNGSFQYTTKENKSWIHRDPTNFSVVIYLTPNAPVNGGTVLYRHKLTGLERAIEMSPDDIQLNSDGNDELRWEIVDKIGNKFNRAIIFQGGLSHKSDAYFGDDMYTGRLFQTFFFNVDGRKF